MAIKLSDVYEEGTSDWTPDEKCEKRGAGNYSAGQAVDTLYEKSGKEIINIENNTRRIRCIINIKIEDDKVIDYTKPRGWTSCTLL